MPPADLTGLVFGSLVVIGDDGTNDNGKIMWKCRCECGAMSRVTAQTLTRGRAKICRSCANSARATTHGMYGSLLYFRWRGMLGRHRPSVCERWWSFDAFASDMGPSFRDDLKLGRVNYALGYSPENCRWVTHVEQNRSRVNNHLVTWHGRTLTLVEWGERLGISHRTIATRLRRGWSVEQALQVGRGRKPAAHSR